MAQQDFVFTAPQMRVAWVVTAACKLTWNFSANAKVYGFVEGRQTIS